jgi:hypothetical protein
VGMTPDFQSRSSCSLAVPRSRAESRSSASRGSSRRIGGRPCRRSRSRSFATIGQLSLCVERPDMARGTSRATSHCRMAATVGDSSCASESRRRPCVAGPKVRVVWPGQSAHTAGPSRELRPMNSWIRPPSSGPTDAEPWHLQMSMSYSGLRIAKCGYNLPPFELVEQRPFEDVPSDAICVDCAPTD